jgi:hypothetical protein
MRTRQRSAGFGVLHSDESCDAGERFRSSLSLKRGDGLVELIAQDLPKNWHWTGGNIAF